MHASTSNTAHPTTMAGMQLGINVANTYGGKAQTKECSSRMFGSLHVGGCHFAMGDGAVRFVSENTNITVLRNLSIRDDGNVVGEF